MITNSNTLQQPAARVTLVKIGAAARTTGQQLTDLLTAADAAVTDSELSVRAIGVDTDTPVAIVIDYIRDADADNATDHAVLLIGEAPSAPLLSAAQRTDTAVMIARVGGMEPLAQRLTDTSHDMDLPLFHIRERFGAHDTTLLARQIMAQLNMPCDTLTDKALPLAMYPSAPSQRGGATALSEEHLAETLAQQLPDWTMTSEPSNSQGTAPSTDITRQYKFPSFRHAVRFMDQTAPACDIADHHPRWENNWRTLQVWLTTWDAGRQITERDIQLARYLDAVYAGINK